MFQSTYVQKGRIRVACKIIGVAKLLSGIKANLLELFGFSAYNWVIGLWGLTAGKEEICISNFQGCINLLTIFEKDWGEKIGKYFEL